MLKRIWCIFCIVSLLFVSFGTLNVQAETGTDPEPVRLFPTDDAYIVKSKPDINYDYYPPTEGEIGLLSVWGGYYHTYMKFDISNVDEINNASLHLYGEHSRTLGSDYILIYEVYNTEWSETSITWNNAPVNNFTQTEHTDYKLIKEFNVYRNQGYYDYKIDIKDFLTEKVNEGKSCITLALCGNSSHFTFKIHSKDLVGIPGGNDGPTAPCLIINEDNIPPSAPQNFTAEAVSAEEIELSWDASTDNVAVAGYEIYVNDQKVTVTSDVYAVVSGLQPSTWYTLYVKAFDTSQNLSEPSETVTVQTLHLPDDEPPSIPQNLKGKALSPSKIKLTWDPSTDNIGVVGYIVYCNGTEIATTDSEGYLGYIVEGLSAGTTYTFSVKAFDIQENESKLSDEISVTTLSERDTEPPTKPTNLEISDLSTYSSKADLTWDASEDNIEVAGYIIYVNSSEKARVSATSTSYQFTDLTPNTEYSIYIKAFDEAGNRSEASDILTVTTSYVTMRSVGTEGQYATIQEAVSAANPGDVILVKDGTYIENVTISRPGTADQWITIMAEGTDAVIQGLVTVNASYIRVSGIKMYKPARGGGVNIKKPYVQVTNMDIRNAPAAFYLEGSAGNIYIADNYIYKCQYGIFGRGNNNIYERNEIEYLDNEGSGDADYFRVFGDNVIIRNNYCHGTVWGPHLGSAHVDFVQSYDDEKRSTKNVLIENNIVTGFLHQGFMLENDANPGSFYISDWVIRNNIISGYQSWGLNAGKTNGGIPNIVIENNLFIGDPNGPGRYGAHNGICIDGEGGYGVIRNNIIMNSDTSYFATDGTVLIEHGNNLIYNSSIPPVMASTDIFGIDPLLVDPFNPENPDFHLQPASHAIDNGADVNFSYDLEGNVRPFGGGFDIGPYEFQGIKENTAPIIVIVSPSEGDGYKIGSDVDIEVNAKDDGKVVKVEYYLNDSYIGEAVSEPFNFTLSNIPEGINTLYAIAYDDVGLSNKSAEVIFIVSDSDSMVVGSSFKNLTIPDQKGIATVTFDAIPMADNMNGVIGVTFGQASAFSDLAAIVRFNPDGLIDALKGGATPSYTYENQIPYSAWKIYKFTMTIDISNRIFSATVRDEEGNTHVIAENYPFRLTGAVGADKLDTIAGLSEVSSYILLFNPDDHIPVEAESVDIKEESIKIKVGSTRKLNATVYPENAYNKVLEWTSSDESIATVDENGTVTAISEGEALITARVVGTSLYDNCVVTVAAAQGENSPPVFVPVGEKSVNVGSTLEFTVSATDSDGDQLTYSAEDLPVGASFDEQTLIFSWTPQQGQEGEYTVTFTVTDGVNEPVETTVEITVNPAVEDEYAFTITNTSINKQAGIAAEATVTAIGEGRNAVVIFKLMKTDGTVIGLYSSEQYIEDSATFRVKFHGYSGNDYKVKVYVWDELDSSLTSIGVDLAVPVEIQ